ncbi:MAG: DUF839 domain-containing protein [Chromatiales bacterium]|nr:DUF839 domain-containing protein [Chromatiales bacterium]
MLSKHFKSRGIVLFSSAAVLSMVVGLTACNDSDDKKAITSVEFTSTPAPSSNADLVRATTSSKVIVTYDDGSTEEFPLSYNTLFKNVDRVGSSANEAGRLYDYQGNPLVDPNGDPLIAETADANSLLEVGDKLFLVNHWEYDWILANGTGANKAPNWYSRAPMSMNLTNIAQDKDSGKLTATDQRPIDFSGVDGLWIPCFGSQSPWNTHLGSEEDYDLYFVKASGGYDTATSNGLKAMTELYFKNSRQANPYHYGYIPEVKVNSDGSTEVKKHYNMGRGTWEQTIFMPDSRTAYFGDDGTNVFLAMFVGDVAADPSAGGTLYAARWNQTSSANGGAANLSWVRLGHATSAEVKALIDGGITFWDIFDITTPDTTPDWAAQGYKAIRAGQSTTEYVRLKSGMEQAAAFLEPRRYAAYLGATTEFNKMEGVAVNRADKKLYMAMSYIDKGMLADATGPVDHIQTAKINAGGSYEIQMAGGQTDTGGSAINSEWVGVSMHVPTALLGQDISADALGNVAHPDKVANPDNMFFSEGMRTLFIGEDSGTHVNNFVWAYNVDTGKLSRILSLPSGAESTGLQVVDNVNGHAYIMSNNQHQGEWISSMPASVKSALTAEATAQYGVNAHGTPNYYLEAHVGYIGGIPGL